MEETAISIENVSKKFRLFNSPQERLLEALHPFNKKYHKEFWALKEINFEVKKGSTFGIIGRNGAGKSTLLQIICSILRPTSGTVTVKGRVSALLALGAGFNPEFTGRQNVLMNGALLGFSGEEIKKRLPEIEAFADIGEFIDQPMKIYSSGMSLRLAFAAAINVDPDILVVDEALAVGDAKFQHKCYGKFLEFQKAGKTIIFVSHDMNAIVRHCSQALSLEKGYLIYMGLPKDVVHRYHELILTGSVSEKKSDNIGDAAKVSQSAFPKHARASVEEFIYGNSLVDNCSRRKSYNKNEFVLGDKRGMIIDYLLVCDDSVDANTVFSGDNVDVYMKCKFDNAIKRPIYGIAVKTIDNVLIYGFNTRFSKLPLQPVKQGDIVVFKYTIKLDVAAGDIFIDLGLAEEKPEIDAPVQIRESIIHLHIMERGTFTGLVRFPTRQEEVTVISCSTFC
jgi:lipopolysaccharide transport system ATP-binding protein